MQSVHHQSESSTTPPPTGRVKTRADRLREATGGYPVEVKQARRWVAFMGADPGTLPESNMQLAGTASLADPASWTDLHGAIELAHANRQTNGVAFVVGDGWVQARVTNPTEADRERGVVAERCADGSNDVRVLLQHRVEDDEVHPRYPDESRWTTINHRLWAIPTLTLTGSPPNASELIDLVQAKPEWLTVMAAYDGIGSDTDKGNPDPVARILFTTALENSERGSADSAYFIDTVQSAMVKLKIDPPSKRHLQTIYTARKNALPPRVKERTSTEKRRERAERQDGFVDDIQQAHGLADALLAEGHKFQTDDGPDGRWLVRDEHTGLLSRAAIKGNRGMAAAAMSWVEVHAELLQLGNLSALARSRSLLAAASDLPRLHVQRQHIDQHPELIGTPDGVLDIATGQIRKATSAELITRQTSHAPASTYRGSVFYDWLQQTVPDDAERELLQNLAGYTLQGKRDGKLFVVLHGVRGAAKSAFLRAMAELLGSGPNGHYTAGTKRGIYSSDGECSVEYAINMMEGFRLAVFDELQPERAIDEDMLKSITGAANQSARERHGHERNSNITATMWMGTNSLPRVRFGGDPMVIRARLFEWTTVLDRPNIHAELLADRPALFAWMLEGAQRYMREGTACLAPTADMLDAATAWLGESVVNPMRRFVAERLEYVPGGWVFTDDLRQEWDLWRESLTGGQRVDSPWNANLLADALMNTGYRTAGTNAPYPEPVRSTNRDRLQNDGTKRKARGWTNLMVRRDPPPTARQVYPF